MTREELDRARAMRREMTRAEVILWTRLKGKQLRGYQFNRQKKIGPYYADFACAAARLVVEVDGATHGSPEERAYDAARTAFMEREGWRVVRVWNGEVYENERGVAETILRWLEGAGCSPGVGTAPSVSPLCVDPPPPALLVED